VLIIAMTAGSLEALSAEILGAGANIVIAKPIKIDELAQIVGEQLVRS
jgi:DNA-binding response OmpR family regulator